MRRKGFLVRQTVGGVGLKKDRVFAELSVSDDVLLRFAEHCKYDMELRAAPGSLAPTGRTSLWDSTQEALTQIPVKGSHRRFRPFEMAKRAQFHPLKPFQRAELSLRLLQDRDDGVVGVALDLDRELKYKRIAEYYLLHDPLAQGELKRSWVRLFRPQPIQKINDYLGPKIAMYFSFLGFYTASLLFPAAIGIAAFVLSQLKNRSADSEIAPYYCAFLAVWATLFSEFWKRTQNTHAHTWNTLEEDLEEDQRPRGVFAGTERTGFYTSRGFVPLEKSEYPPAEAARLPETLYFPRWRVRAAQAVSAVVVLLMIGVVIGVSLGTLYMRLYLQKNFDAGRKSRIKWGSIGAGVTQGVLITLLNFLYEYLALALNRMENHRTETDYENNLVIKLFSFQFVNSFFSLFYVAFIKQSGRGIIIDGEPDSCKPDCMSELSEQLASIMISRQIISQLVEVGIPFITERFKRYQEREDRSGRVPTAAERDGVLVPFEGTIGEYSELLIQFSYCTLFAAAFPPAALFALLNNVVELRTDALKILVATRRPTPVRTRSIGVFGDVLAATGYLAVVMNCLVLGFVSTTLRDSFQSAEERFGLPVNNFRRLLWTLVVVVVAEHILLLFKALIAYIIPDVPRWVEVSIVRNQNELRISESLRSEQAHRRIVPDLNVTEDLNEEANLKAQTSKFV
jgi:hypothetical protein